MGEPIDIDALVRAIAAKFREYAMHAHLEQLRGYYRDRTRRTRARLREPMRNDTPFNEDLVIEWAALWRLPPFDKIYPIKAPRSACDCGEPRSAEMHSHLFTRCVFPEGRVVGCAQCSCYWLELESGTKTPK